MVRVFRVSYQLMVGVAEAYLLCCFLTLSSTMLTEMEIMVVFKLVMVDGK